MSDREKDKPRHLHNFREEDKKRTLAIKLIEEMVRLSKGLQTDSPSARCQNRKFKLRAGERGKAVLLLMTQIRAKGKESAACRNNQPLPLLFLPSGGVTHVWWGGAPSAQDHLLLLLALSLSLLYSHRHST